MLMRGAALAGAGQRREAIGFLPEGAPVGEAPDRCPAPQEISILREIAPSGTPGTTRPPALGVVSTLGTATTGAE